MAEIQQAMDDLSPGYSLDFFDFTDYPEIQVDWRDR
jgi:hypothetical protein